MEWFGELPLEGHLAVNASTPRAGAPVLGTAFNGLGSPATERGELLGSNQGFVARVQGVTEPVKVLTRLGVAGANNLDRNNPDSAKEVGPGAGFFDKATSVVEGFGGGCVLAANLVTSVGLEKHDVLKRSFNAILGNPVKRPITGLLERSDETGSSKAGHQGASFEHPKFSSH